MKIPDYLPDSMPESSAMANKQELTHRIDAALALLGGRRDSLVAQINNPTLDNAKLFHALLACEELEFEINCTLYIQGVESLELMQQLWSSPEEVERAQKFVDDALSALRTATRDARQAGGGSVDALLNRYGLTDIVNDI